MGVPSMIRPAHALFLLLAACLVPGSRPSAAAATCPAELTTIAPGWTTGLRVSGQKRSFYSIFPEEPLADGAPLLLGFNGTGEDGLSFARRAQLEDFAEAGFVVLSVSSNGNGTVWPVWDALRTRGEESGPNADLELYDTLRACAVKHLGVDPRRVYVGGHSAGGIFTNYLLQRRSYELAGGIVASGIYSQTSPAEPGPLDPTVVLVTWGGANDIWSGRAGASAVKNLSFASEASLASVAYSRHSGTQVVNCEGEDLGHEWLHELNGWMAEVLLARPKGAPPITNLPPLPAAADARCFQGAWQESVGGGSVCAESVVPGCQHACQQLADGVVHNRTVGPVMRPELRALGFSSDASSDCAECVTRCEAAAVAPADAQVLACLGAQKPVDPRAGGIDGALPLIDAVNTCCEGEVSSGWCEQVCGEMRGNLAARAYFDSCSSRAGRRPR